MATNEKFYISILLIFLSLYSSSLAHIIPSYPRISHNFSFNYIFQFGDSLNDVGNLRAFPVGIHNVCGGRPYGVSINKTTGRCSDGLLMIDYIANFFHLPTPGPYLAQGEQFDHGANFAVAGATAIDADILRARGIDVPFTNASLSIEIKRFKSLLHFRCGSIYGRECKKLVGDSLILLGAIGGNDINFALFNHKPIEELYEMVHEVTKTIYHAVKELISMGATRIVVPGNFPYGCLPIYLTMFETTDKTMYDKWGCLRYLDDFTVAQNKYLLKAISRLQKLYPDVAIVYGDYYGAYKWMLKNAVSLGFKADEIHKSCCGKVDGKHNYDKDARCGMPGVPVCENPQERISFDGIHLTERAYFYMTRWLLRSFIPELLKLIC